MRLIMNREYKLGISLVVALLVVVGGLFLFEEIKERFFPEEKVVYTGTMVELSDEQLNEIIGQQGLFLTEVFGFTIPNDITGNQCLELIGNQMESIKDPIELANVYISIISGLNDAQATEVTKVVLTQLIYAGMEELKNLSRIAGFEMQVEGFEVTIETSGMSFEVRP